MSTIWTWNRPWQALSAMADSGGWEIDWGYIIPAPQSLQRLVFRLGMSGVDVRDFAVLNESYCAGLITARIVLDRVGDAESIALITRGVQQTVTLTGDPAGTTLTNTVYAWHDPIELDINLRAAAPPPPADGLGLSGTINYEPNTAGANATQHAVTWWKGKLDLQYLTSEPGP